MNNPFDLLQNMGSFKEKFSQAESIVRNTQATGSAGAGMVTVTANGMGNILEVKIDPELMKGDVHTLEVLFAAATNDAAGKVQEKLKDKGQEFLGGLGR